jgi:hypothetical protein
MDTNQFWNIVEDSRKEFRPDLKNGNMDRQVQTLKRLLSALPADAVIEFDRIMGDLLRQSYSWELWGAAYILAEGCSDDSFDYFHAWLISMGRRVFEAALADPESLATAAYAPGVEDVFFEDFLYVAGDVAEAMGAGIPESDVPFPDNPSGKEWREESDDLEQMFPKLWACAQSRN